MFQARGLSPARGWVSIFKCRPGHLSCAPRSVSGLLLRRIVDLLVGAPGDRLAGIIAGVPEQVGGPRLGPANPVDVAVGVADVPGAGVVAGAGVGVDLQMPTRPPVLRSQIRQRPTASPDRRSARRRARGPACWDYSRSTGAGGWSTARASEPS